MYSHLCTGPILFCCLPPVCNKASTADAEHGCQHMECRHECVGLWVGLQDGEGVGTIAQTKCSYAGSSGPVDFIFLYRLTTYMLTKKKSSRTLDGWLLYIRIKKTRTSHRNLCIWSFSLAIHIPSRVQVPTKLQRVCTRSIVSEHESASRNSLGFHFPRVVLLPERGSSVACLPWLSSFLITFRKVEVSNKADSSSVLALAGLNTSGLFSQAEVWQNCKTQYAG